MTKREREYTDRIYEYMDLLDTKYHEEIISGKNITLTNKEFCNLFNFITCIDCGFNNWIVSNLVRNFIPEKSLKSIMQR